MHSERVGWKVSVDFILRQASKIGIKPDPKDAREEKEKMHQL